MTTAPLPPRPAQWPVRVSPEVRLAAAATLSLAVVAVALAALASGPSGAWGAATGTLIVVGFFGFGALTVDAVATVSPGASLLVALLTYTLEVVAVGVAFAVLDGSGALGTTMDAGWVAGAVILGTLAWTTALVVAATRSRQPLFDLSSARPAGAGDRPEASAP